MQYKRPDWSLILSIIHLLRVYVDIGEDMEQRLGRIRALNEKTITQTSHIEFTAPRGSLYDNSFCIFCGLIGIGAYIIGWLIFTLQIFP